MSVVLLGGKPVFSGTRTQEKVKKIKSPPADIFCYGISKGTTKKDIVDDLDEADFKITVDDIVQMYKPNINQMLFIAINY